MTSPDNGGELQFESVVPRGADGSGTEAGSPCAVCQTPLEGEYFDVNGRSICRACSEKVAYQAATPREMSTLVRAGVAGVLAALLGAVVYFAVMAISGFEVGLVAIAIGYMVGYGVRLGTRGRGGRRFQVLAVVLTYWAVGLAYSSLAIKSLIDDRTKGASASLAGPQKSGVAAPAAATPVAPAGDTAEDGSLVLSLLQVLAFTVILPVMVIVSALPGGLISGAIIVFGMMQAWKMTAAPSLTVSGPYRIEPMSAAG